MISKPHLKLTWKTKYAKPKFDWKVWDIIQFQPATTGKALAGVLHCTYVPITFLQAPSYRRVKHIRHG